MRHHLDSRDLLTSSRVLHECDGKVHPGVLVGVQGDTLLISLDAHEDGLPPTPVDYKTVIPCPAYGMKIRHSYWGSSYDMVVTHHGFPARLQTKSGGTMDLTLSSWVSFYKTGRIRLSNWVTDSEEATFEA